MANTYVYSESGGALHTHATGYVDCDGSTDADVICGFIPTKVVCHIINTPTSTAAAGAQYVWQTPMDTEEASVDHTIVIPAAGTAVTVSDAGIVPYTGTVETGEDDGTGEGFTVPAGLLANLDRLYWIAYR